MEKRKTKPKTTEEALELLEKASEQYRVYQEYNDVSQIGREPDSAPPPAPTPEHPLTTNTLSAKN